jgi:hypothetical protein
VHLSYESLMLDKLDLHISQLFLITVSDMLDVALSANMILLKESPTSHLWENGLLDTKLGFSLSGCYL